MPPELKKPITKLEEMTCENCVFSVHHWQEQKNPNIRSCKLHLLDQKDDFSQVTTSEHFCSEGQWRIRETWKAEANENEVAVIFVERFNEIYDTFSREADLTK